MKKTAVSNEISTIKISLMAMVNYKWFCKYCIENEMSSAVTHLMDLKKNAYFSQSDFKLLVKIFPFFLHPIFLHSEDFK